VRIIRELHVFVEHSLGSQEMELLKRIADVLEKHDRLSSEIAGAMKDAEALKAQQEKQSS